MLDIRGAPVLDKSVLVGGCLRLPLTVDAERLAREVWSLPVSLWGASGGRVGVQGAAEAVFLRGHAPAEGDKPVSDRDALAGLDYVKFLITELVPATPMRCLLARLPGGGSIAPHIDKAPYFSKTLRVHVPVTTHERVFMVAAGQVYNMRVGEVWMLNNSGEHAVYNTHPTESRTHLICDFLPSTALLGLMATGERGLGTDPSPVARYLAG